jgi:dimethylamine/trimethylamine dehydrogenase
MIVGAGPAGLEAARALGQRGNRVQLLDARPDVGGRVTREALLPGLGPWRRVVEWRRGEIAELPAVEVFPSSPMTAQDVLDSGARHVVVATGATWRRDGRGRSNGFAVAGHEHSDVFTPDDVLDDLESGQWRIPPGRVVIYDDDHYVMGGLLAELLAGRGHEVELLTPAPLVSHWTQYTLEQERIERRLRSLGVQIHTRTTLQSIGADHVVAEAVIDGRASELPRRSVVLVADRLPRTELYEQLLDLGGLDTLQLIGDADAPGLIAQAVFSGHRAARQFGESVDRDAVEFLREV